MRFLSARLQNYRIHKDFFVEFAKGVSLIQGPNESGKSTLVEAMHRALFLRAKVGGEVLKNMLSKEGGDPVVELSLEAQGRNYLLIKKFNATGGTTSLKGEGVPTLTGEAAEDALSKLLRVDHMISGKQTKSLLPNRWAHLWVWQGSSDLSPLEAASESHRTLREKLQQKVGTRLSASPIDNELISRLQVWHNDTFTTSGKAKAGSNLKQAEEALEAANSAEREKKEALQNLDLAARQYTEAEESIQRHETTIKEAKKNLAHISGKLKEATVCREQLQEKSFLRKEAEKEWNELQQAEKQLKEWETDLEKKRDLAKPGEQNLEELSSKLAQLRTSLQKASTHTEQAIISVNQAQNRQDCLEAHVALLRLESALKDREKRQEKILQLEEKRKQASEALARLHKYTPEAIKSLRAKESALNAAEAKLEAYALKLEVLTSKKPIRAGDLSVSEGSSTTLTETTDIETNDGTVLRVSPGGTTDLETARRHSKAAKQDFDLFLKTLGANSLEQAELRANELRQAHTDHDKWQSRINDLEPEVIAKLLEEGRQEVIRLRTARDQSIDGMKKIEFPSDPANAEESSELAKEAFQIARQNAESAQQDEKLLRSTIEKTSSELEKLRGENQTLEKEVQRLGNLIQFEEKRWGDAKSRRAKIKKAQENLTHAKEAEETQEKNLKAFGISELELDQTRLNQAITNSETLLRTARDQFTAARTRLERSENIDPEGDYKKAVAERERQEKSLKTADLQAKARSYLLEQLKAEQKKITTAISRPLEEAASPYLESLFGLDSKAHLQWSEDGGNLVGLSIERPQHGYSFLEFEELSYGTREQVALALRLAMAQLLAVDYDGSLPLVLDDAFTHADRYRIEKLQRLLFRAANNGLQILLLTCHPENYTGLTEHEVSMNQRLNPHQTNTSAEQE